MLQERGPRMAGLSGMETSAQYRAFADDCVRLAQRAKTDEERKILLEMAGTWKSLAEEADQQDSKTIG
jgi:hypothetical protein